MLCKCSFHSWSKIPSPQLQSFDDQASWQVTFHIFKQIVQGLPAICVRGQLCRAEALLARRTLLFISLAAVVRVPHTAGS